jgi:hypothetical protein
MYHALKGENGIRSTARRWAQSRGPDGELLYPNIAQFFERAVVSHLYQLNNDENLLGRPDQIELFMLLFDIRRYAPEADPSPDEIVAMRGFINVHIARFCNLCLGSTGTSLNESFHAAMRYLPTPLLLPRPSLAYVDFSHLL